MKSQQDIVGRLGDLTADDRAWILARLSPGARAALLDSGATGHPPQKTQPGQGTESARVREPARQFADARDKTHAALATADARHVAAALRDEPVWIIHAILSQPWPWRDDVIGSLQPMERAELDRLAQSGVRHADKLIKLVEGKLATVLGETVMDSKRTGFDGIMAALGARLARRRTGLGL